MERSGPRGVYIDRLFGEVRWAAQEVREQVVLVPEVRAAPPGSIAEAMRYPLGSTRLAEIARGCRTVAIITSDATRSVPCAELLDVVVPELAAGGIELSNITLVVGVGAHRPATEQEMSAYLGNWRGLVRAETHDAHSRAGLVNVGSTALGDVDVNRTVVAADLRVAFGQVEPHEFAGFSGGPKSVLAGVSGASTIARNHSPGMLSHVGARPGRTVGNPIWEDMLEAAELVGVEFIVNVVLNVDRAIASVRAGSLRAAHSAAVDDYVQLYAASWPEEGSADVLVTTPGPPLDINLYQCLKALIAGEIVVKDGGVVFLYGSCQEGIGHADFSKPFDLVASLGDVPALLADEAFYTAPMDHALLLANLFLERRLQVVLYAPGVDQRTSERMGFIVEDDMQAAFNRSLKLAGKQGGPPNVVFFPCPQRSVPAMIRSKGSGTSPADGLMPGRGVS